MPTFIPKPTASPWRCSIQNCRALLGMKHSGGLLVVKHKDLAVEIGGEYQVTVGCRHCGARNVITATKLDTLLKEAGDGT